MRRISDYSLRDWAVGEPFAHRLRRARNIAIDRLYARRRAPGQEAVVRALATLPRPRAALTIAFNLPEAIDLLSQGLARFLPDVTLLVCDNSSKPDARQAIAALCAVHGHLYCALPPAPRLHAGPNGSRSHGVALNWVWGNLVRPAGLEAVALLDHDLLPLAPDDLFARLAGQPAYGMVRHGERFGGWFLWPGYCVFDATATRHMKLDFGTDTPLTLDTGGQNWRVLYRRMPLARLSMAQTRQVFLTDPETGEREPFLLVDNWLHVGGAGHRGGGAAALARVRRAFEADPDGLLERLISDQA